MVAQATKEKSFSLGNPTMFDTTKDVCYQQYHTALTKRMNNLFSYVNSYPLSLVEKANIEHILSQWDIIYENIPADFLYIVQTQCIYVLGCPMLDWNRKLYLKEVYTFIKKYELIDDNKAFNMESKEKFLLMLSSIGIDKSDELELFLIQDEGFTVFQFNESISNLG
jgi:hypothetical protein